MISRIHRFHGYGSLNFIYRHGKTARSQLFALRYIPNPKRSEFRAAVVVSRKVNKSAVVRNRIRRRLYELLREEAANLKSPHDLVITVFSDRVAAVDSAELRKALVACLKSAGLR